MSNKEKILEVKKDVAELNDTFSQISEKYNDINAKLDSLAVNVIDVAPVVHGVDPLIFGITIFVLACFVGYYVVWRVTPALHTPLMSVTNAISGIIIVGAMVALGGQAFTFSKIFGFFAVLLASINIFGGFVVTQRMLAMFRKR